VVYASNELGSSDVYVISIDGASKWPVTTTGGANPVWATDDTRIYYSSGSILYEISVETNPVFRVVGQPQEVFDAESPFRFDVHPSGDGFVLSRIGGVGRGHFELIYNFPEYLKDVAPVVK